LGGISALPEAVFRARLQQGNGFIPFPSKSPFYCVTAKRIKESANKKSSPKMKKLPQISESNNGTTNRPENTAHFPV
jgi:hypothetical protein